MAKKEPRITITVDDLENRKLNVKIENWEGIPASILDRVDVLIEKQLYFYHMKTRQKGIEEENRRIAADLRKQSGDGRVVSQSR